MLVGRIGSMQRLPARGQSASSAAILVAIIGAIIILYILFLPPGEREQLLFGDEGVPGPGGGSYQGGGQGVFTQRGPLSLLTAVPGTLRQQRFPTEEHDIPSATIFTKIETEEIKHIDSAIVKAGVFSSKDVAVDFQASKQGMTNYLLSFNVRQTGEGPLRILLNGRLIYERPLAEGTPSPIALPMDYIEDGTNTIRLETDSAGMAFWKANAYVLGNILVSADRIDQSGSVSQQTFSMQERELQSMESAELRFVPECDPRKAGRLTVQLNSRTVQDGQNSTMEVPNTLYTGFVDCGVLFKTDVPREHLRVGENRLLFASQGGQYIVDRIKLIVNLKEQDYPVYYFNLDPELYDSLDLGQGALRMTVRFADFRQEKRGEVVLNGFVQSFQTQEYVYQALIDPGIVVPGPNTIQIIPHVDRLDIAELRVELI